MNPVCLTNAGLGNWYSKGSQRLASSLCKHNFSGAQLIWINEWPSNRYDRKCVYHVKADAVETAMKQGHTTIIWADSSIYALKSPQPFVDRIAADGYWIGQSGHNCAQVCTDAQLEYFGVSRDAAEKMPDCLSGLFGFDTTRPAMRAVMDRWIKAAKDGAFKSSRFRAGQSKDLRFLYARQDQSCLSLILAQAGIPLRGFGEFARFAWDRYEAVFHCQGM